MTNFFACLFLLLLSIAIIIGVMLVHPETTQTTPEYKNVKEKIMIAEITPNEVKTHEVKKIEGNLFFTNNGITFSDLGSYGRFGNQLFQIAATIGISKHVDKFPIFKSWSYESVFNKYPSIYKIQNTLFKTISHVNHEDAFSFEIPKNIKEIDNNLNIQGYRQNVRYFNHIVNDIRTIFEFESTLLQKVTALLPINPIGVHVRRGDYVNHPIHGVCTIQYYTDSIEYFQTKSLNANVFIISDDIPWCKRIFSTIKNVTFCDETKSEQEDFIALSLCPYKVISNSTFGWWAAWLDARYDSQVIVPSPWIRNLGDGYKNLYQDSWIIYNVEEHKFLSTPITPIPISAIYYSRNYSSIHESFQRIYPKSDVINYHLLDDLNIKNDYFILLHDDVVLLKHYLLPSEDFDLIVNKDKRGFIFKTSFWKKFDFRSITNFIEFTTLNNGKIIYDTVNILEDPLEFGCVNYPSIIYGSK
jgi:hypothetical protein